MAKYVAIDAIKKRLEGKVDFDSPGGTDPNKLGNGLMNSLINEAETQLEIDLMHRYELPFQCVNGDPFAKLPNTTKTTITAAAELLSVIRILETDFGRGTSSNSDKYTEKLQKRYDDFVAKLVEKKKRNGQETETWKLPPLPGIKLAYNNQGDTGFQGRVMNTSEVSHEADFAYKQINSPGENFFNGWLDPLDQGDTG